MTSKSAAELFLAMCLVANLSGCGMPSWKGGIGLGATAKSSNECADKSSTLNQEQLEGYWALSERLVWDQVLNMLVWVSSDSEFRNDSGAFAPILSAFGNSIQLLNISADSISFIPDREKDSYKYHLSAGKLCSESNSWLLDIKSLDSKQLEIDSSSILSTEFGKRYTKIDKVTFEKLSKEANLREPERGSENGKNSLVFNIQKGSDTVSGFPKNKNGRIKCERWNKTGLKITASNYDPEDSHSEEYADFKIPFGVFKSSTDKRTVKFSYDAEKQFIPFESDFALHKEDSFYRIDGMPSNFCSVTIENNPGEIRGVFVCSKVSGYLWKEKERVKLLGEHALTGQFTCDVNFAH